ncbi:MAG: hypothetical protein K5656_01715 [Lachnospiraceae bacterium]|nr:hypothetical protein [Lachnospiraceae bacterium]
MAEKEYETLAFSWLEVLEWLAEDLGEFDVETVKKLIFDTYHFYKKEVGDNGEVSRNLMIVYKYVSQAGFYLSTQFIDGVPESVSTTCADFLAGLSYVIEKTFDAGYGKNPLPMGLARHTPAGCADAEADMTTYETFEKDFNDNITFLQEEFDMD